LKPKPVQPALASPQDYPDFLFLPGHLFFCEYAQIPPHLSDDELQEFAEMTIRSLSPFPIEHVYWGWYKDQHYPWMLIYAATMDSLNRAGYGELEPFQQVFPSFLTTVPLTFEDPTLFYYYHPHTQTLTLHIHPGKQHLPETSQEAKDEKKEEDDDSEDLILPDIQLPIIHSVHVIAAEPDFDDERVEEEELEEGEIRMPTFEDISDAREHIQAQLPNPDQYKAEDTWLEYVVGTRSKDQSIQFHHQWGSSSDPHPGPETEITSSQAWQADVRRLEFKAEARQKRKRERQLAVAAKIAGFVAILLIFLELAAIVGEKWSLKMSEEASAAQPNVDLILGKRELLFKIEQVSTNNLVPFKMLQTLNNYRTGGIFFEEVEASQGNRMVVEGKAENSAEMNAYKKALIDSGELLTCELDMDFKKGVLYFVMDATFPPYKPRSISPPASKPESPTPSAPIPGTTPPDEPPTPTPAPPNTPTANPPSAPPGLPPGLPPLPTFAPPNTPGGNPKSSVPKAPSTLPPLPDPNTPPATGSSSTPNPTPSVQPKSSPKTVPLKSTPPKSTDPQTKNSPSKVPPFPVPISPINTKPPTPPTTIPSKPPQTTPKSTPSAPAKTTPSTKTTAPQPPKAVPVVPGFPAPTLPPPKPTASTPAKTTTETKSSTVDKDETKAEESEKSDKKIIVAPGFPAPQPLPNK
jgi:hypothetical protein